MEPGTQRSYCHWMQHHKDLREQGSGPNPVPPTNMTPSERRGELVRLLALGLVRMNARQSSELFSQTENSFVDLPLNQSGHATRSTGECHDRS